MPLTRDVALTTTVQTKNVNKSYLARFALFFICTGAGPGTDSAFKRKNVFLAKHWLYFCFRFLLFMITMYKYVCQPRYLIPKRAI
jgi:hypothetical protein